MFDTSCCEVEGGGERAPLVAPWVRAHTLLLTYMRPGSEAVSAPVRGSCVGAREVHHSPVTHANLLRNTLKSFCGERAKQRAPLASSQGKVGALCAPSCACVLGGWVSQRDSLHVRMLPRDWCSIAAHDGGWCVCVLACATKTRRSTPISSSTLCAKQPLCLSLTGPQPCSALCGEHFSLVKHGAPWAYRICERSDARDGLHTVAVAGESFSRASVRADVALCCVRRPRLPLQCNASTPRLAPLATAMRFFCDGRRCAEQRLVMLLGMLGRA